MNRVDVSEAAINREIIQLCEMHNIDLTGKAPEKKSMPDTESLFAVDEPEAGNIDSEVTGGVSESGAGNDEAKTEGGGFIPKGVWDWSAASADREVSEDEQLAMATMILKGGINAAFALGFRSASKHLDQAPVKAFAEKWAVVLCKYYKGGVFELLSRFKEEGAALMATVGLVAAVREAFVQSRISGQQGAAA